MIPNNIEWTDEDEEASDAAWAKVIARQQHADATKKQRRPSETHQPHQRSRPRRSQRTSTEQ